MDTKRHVTRRFAMAVVASLGALAAGLSAVPAEAATSSAPASRQALGANRVVDWCDYGHQCFYDDSAGNIRLFTAARCGEHDLRGGGYQNRINYVDNNSTAHVYLDIWRNAGYWQEYAHFGPWQFGIIWTDDIDRIRIVC
jgi:hypothetical protein